MRRTVTPRAALPDALLWAALAAPAPALGPLGLNEPRPWWQHAAGCAVLALAVALSRPRPVLALLLAAGLGLALSPSLFTLAYGPALAVLAYLLGRRADGPRPALYAFAGLAAAGTPLVALRGVDPVVEWLVLIGTLLFGAVFPWLIGRYGRQHRALVAAGWSRAAQLEREQEIVADRARLRERARIAQDMHDSLGHELSLVALRAGALQVAPGLAPEHRAAAAELRGAAADATDRLREIIGILRDPSPPPLTPADETVAALVARAAASGLPVRLRAPREEARGAASMAARAAYRVVQEALTNAAKHAPGAEVTVDVEERPGETVVTVANGPAPGDGPDRARPPVTVPHGGTGLLGLRERVALAGGDFTAGPRDGGFRVHARLPHTAAAAGADSPVTRARGARTPVRGGSVPDGSVVDGLVPDGPVPDRSGAHPHLPPGTPPSGATPPDAFARARRATRRGIVMPFAVAGAGATVFVTAAFGWYAYVEAHSVLTPAGYAGLRVGTPYAAVAPVLPDREVADPPSDRAPAPPTGADCRYYRASGELFVSVDHYRLCFRDDRLVAKDRVPRAGTPHTVDQEERE
ncbi:histidine kinase [Streptomyces sp. HU2014]|uniref:sensor histidine kinase n=1 Tax=Streptomyces sp. HU2014 TaxID=2939414 RepID=UPI0020109DD2|nr:sensor histidine kinase [Streptomyces sp. HU2014]UQI48574.1 histidine kinase [Streptomyces sp. HU2014]